MNNKMNLLITGIAFMFFVVSPALNTMDMALLDQQLLVAAEEGNSERIVELLDAGANIEATNILGWTALHIAASKGHEICVEMLLSHGANIETTNDYGNTALHFAAFNGHIACVEMLLSHGASIEATNNNGDTALHLAAFKGHEICVELLLSYGANVDAITNAGDTALRLAARHKEIVEMINKWPGFVEFRRARRLSICMGLHHRLGQDSVLKNLSPFLLQEICKYTRFAEFQEFQRRLRRSLCNRCVLIGTPLSALAIAVLMRYYRG